MINKNKLESLLLSHWTEFIDSRELISHLETLVQKKPNTIKLSRFELIDHRFLLWIEFQVDKKNYTLEAYLDQDKLIPKNLINIE